MPNASDNTGILSKNYLVGELLINIAERSFEEYFAIIISCPLNKNVCMRTNIEKLILWLNEQKKEHSLNIFDELVWDDLIFQTNDYIKTATKRLRAIDNATEQKLSRIMGTIVPGIYDSIGDRNIEQLLLSMLTCVLQGMVLANKALKRFWMNEVDSSIYNSLLPIIEEVTASFIICGNALVKAESIHTVHGIVIMEIYNILGMGANILMCAGCSKYFVPPNRKDTQYCSKSCKTIGVKTAREEKLKNDESARLYRQVYMKKLMLVRRNDANKYLFEDFEKFKINAKEMKNNIKNGIVPQEDYILWLKNE